MIPFDLETESLGSPLEDQFYISNASPKTSSKSYFSEMGISSSIALVIHY